VAVRVDLESVRVFCPDTEKVVIVREPAQGLEPAAVIVGVDEALEVLRQPLMADIMVALDGRDLDNAVPPLDLPLVPSGSVW
jgi:hypothetical protein